jgi:uncharacterized Zn-binding protein involved in type VI secretion
MKQRMGKAMHRYFNLASVGIVAAAMLAAAPLPLRAEDQAKSPPKAQTKASTRTKTKAAPQASSSNGANATGSTSVIVEGKPAMRAGDASDPGAVEIVPDVFIEGKPAVVCKNGTKSGSASVFIHGKPLARAGDCK